MQKVCSVIVIMLLAISGVQAQKHTPLPHGSTFGKTVDTAQNMLASKLEAFMGAKTRIATTIHGRVLQVDKTKGGWFQLDAGGGKIIKVHFQDYKVSIPVDLKGRDIMLQGIAQRQLLADDMQHFAGDTVVGKKQHGVKVNPKYRLTFEATGLMVL